jgi:hypothetical protein
MKYKHSYKPKGVAQTPKGDIGAHRGEEAYVLGTFKGCETMTAKRAGWSDKEPRTATDEPYKRFKGGEEQ